MSQIQGANANRSRTPPVPSSSVTMKTSRRMRMESGEGKGRAAPRGTELVPVLPLPPPTNTAMLAPFVPQFCLHSFPNTLIEHLLFSPNTDLTINSQTCLGK